LTETAQQAAVITTLLRKTYVIGDTRLEVLKGVDLNIEKGKFTVVSGDSGSGKTTLLNLIAGIDRPTSGRVIVFGEDLSVKDEDFLAVFRCSNVGFVFQSYNLISTLNVAENVGFPMEWLRKPVDYVDKRVQELLAMVGLSSRAEHFPFQLSGGEQQRVAFARALANDPPLLLADEPTGNIDKKTGSKIIEILRMLKDSGKTVVAVTHDERMLELADQSWRLEEGKLVNAYE
jgi:putative ABC transport system ATP-binding protein